jgi:hypothetical protein
MTTNDDSELAALKKSIREQITELEARGADASDER